MVVNFFIIIVGLLKGEGSRLVSEDLWNGDVEGMDQCEERK